MTILTGCVDKKDKEDKQTPERVAAITYPVLPVGWTALDSANGVILGAKQFTRNGTDTADFVIIANMAAGASIRLLDSVYSGNPSSAVFYRFSVTDTGNSFWNLYHNDSSFAMANLQFFENAVENSSTAAVCYPLYYEGNYISYGCNDTSCSDCMGNQKYKQRILLISDSGLAIEDYPDSTNFSNYPLSSAVVVAIVGNAPVNINRSPDSFVARTYIALLGTNLILYTTTNATEENIYQVLQNEFLVDSSNIIMFDGGGSTQMICNGNPFILSSDYRKVPSAIEIRYRISNVSLHASQTGIVK